VQSEIEGGVNLQNLRAGSALQIHTQHTSYNVLVLFGSLAFISGHPLYCPRPVLVTIRGSTWGGSMLKVRSARSRACRRSLCPGGSAWNKESANSLSPLRVVSAGVGGDTK
jgi:hypothetical protein